MTDLICKLFVRESGQNPAESPDLRRRYGTLGSIVGIIVNLLLFAGKIIVGTLTASISVTADAVNNLSDAGSSVISLISFRLSAKPADREHPFGHARTEYVASMIVSFIIMLIGYELFADSLSKVINGGEETRHTAVTMIVLGASILMKIWLCLFNRKVGRRINSGVMRATAADSLSDAVATSAVLVAAVISMVTKYDIDAYMGILASLFIFKSGIDIFRETYDSLLGTQPEEELVQNVERIIMAHPEAIGIHDLMVHNYGPGRCFVSSHVEVDGSRDIFETHDAVDNMEKELFEALGVHCIIHLDPVAVGNPEVDCLREKTLNLVQSVDGRLNIHDFRIVPGKTHCNLIFDIAAPFEMKMTDEELSRTVAEKIHREDGYYFAVITVDRQ